MRQIKLSARCLVLLICLPIMAVANPLVLGRLSKNPVGEIEEQQALADYFAAALRDHGITQGKVIFRQKPEQLAALLSAGAVDVVVDSLFPQLQIHLQADSRLLSKEHRLSGPDYRAIIFVRQNSAIQNIEQLAGQWIAFEDPGSTPSYFLPRLAIEATGHTLVRQSPGVGEVGFRFALDEITISQWVFSGRVAAGTLADAGWDSNGKVPPRMREQFRIIYHSPTAPKAVVAVRSDLSEAWINTLIAAMPAQLNDQQRQALRPYKKLLGYQSLKPEDYQPWLAQIQGNPALLTTPDQ